MTPYLYLGLPKFLLFWFGFLMNTSWPEIQPYGDCLKNILFPLLAYNRYTVKPVLKAGGCLKEVNIAT